MNKSNSDSGLSEGPTLPVKTGRWMFIDCGAGFYRGDMPHAGLCLYEPLGERIVNASHGEKGSVIVTDSSFFDLPGIWV